MAATLTAIVGCGGSTAGKASDGSAGSSAGGTGGGTGGSLNLNLGGWADKGGTGNAGDGTGGTADIIRSLPPGFTPTDVGGYKLGAAFGAGGTGGSGGAGGGGAGAPPTGNCGNVLSGVVRDFKGADVTGGHPDFEAAMHGRDVTPNLVALILGADQKPVYASKCEMGHPSMAPLCPLGAETTTRLNFAQWYQDTAGINEPYGVSFYLAPQPGGLFTFQSLEYFPLDNAGFGNSAVGGDNKMHNFSFTTEVHTQFIYAGGETFRFEGDDDVWVFINNQLAVDLGGLHPKISRSVSLDVSAEQLGIKKGNVYDLDLFHAERHTTQSTFRIDTNLSFVNCGMMTPAVVK